jgi:hypothetical protein
MGKPEVIAFPQRDPHLLRFTLVLVTSLSKWPGQK